MTPSLRGWEAFPTPGALTHSRITWAFPPPAPQVPGVTPGSPLCPWCFGHPFGEVRDSTGSAVAGFARSGRGQSPTPRNSDRFWNPDRVRSPIRHQTPDPEASRDKGKTHALSTTPTFSVDHPLPEQLLTPPSRTTSTRDPRVSSGGKHSEQPAEKSPTPSPRIRKSGVSGKPGSRTPRAEETGDSEDEIATSPTMRRALTRGQAKASPGTSSLVGGLDPDYKERTPKKPRPS
jgi:hypothetical protein